MAQSALTVTPPSPTPPTNMGFTGATPPNPPNYTKNTYNDLKNWAATPPAVTSPPPYYDDGSAGALTQMTSAQPALASGSGDTAGGTGNPVGSTAGTPGTYPGAVNGVVPASTSVEHEGRGTEVVVTSPGSQSYAPTQQVSVLGNWSFSPTQSHASSLSPATNPTLPASPTALSANNTASGTGTIAQTVTGTGFTRQSVIWVNGVPQTTTFTSSTSLTAPAVTKKTSPGTWIVNVVTGGVVQTATPQTWTFT